MTARDATPTVNIIFVTMNAARFVPKALQSIRAQTYPADRIHTIVVDNHSHDETVAILKRDFPWVELIEEKSNHGFAGGNNIGMRAREADYFALINPDAVLDPNWLTNIIDVMENDATIGVAGSKVFYSDGLTLQHAGGMFRENALTYHLGDHEHDNGQYDTLRDVDYVLGAAFMTRGKLARQLNYLPEAYFPAYYEEAEYCTRVRKLGFRVVYVPTAVAWHDEKISGSGKMTFRFLRLYHRHRYLYALRNLTTPEERERFIQAERAWRNQYAYTLNARLLLWYSKLAHWRLILRDPWLLRA